MSKGGLVTSFQRKVSPGAGIVLLSTIGASLLFALSPRYVQEKWLDWFVATEVSVWTDCKFWQLVTTALVPIDSQTSALDLLSLLFNSFMLWTFMPTIERWWGKKRLLTFALWMSVAGSIAGTAVGSLLGAHSIVSGIDPFVFGGIVVFGVLFSDQRVQFFAVLPMTGRQLVIGMSAFVGIFLVLGQRWAEGSSMAGAMLLAWAMATGRFAPKLWYLRWRQKRLRSKFRVIRREDDSKRWKN